MTETPPAADRSGPGPRAAVVAVRADRARPQLIGAVIRLALKVKARRRARRLWCGGFQRPGPPSTAVVA